MNITKKINDLKFSRINIQTVEGSPYSPEFWIRISTGKFEMSA